MNGEEEEEEEEENGDSVSDAKNKLRALIGGLDKNDEGEEEEEEDTL